MKRQGCRLDPEGAQRLLERNLVEVAPLAFMRGRAQPVDRKVLTPSGWQEIGTLAVGDLVIGSDGMPTPVLGVFPQGRKEVFRVRAQDGSSTLACGEHLWTVKTLDDKKHGTPGRTLQTTEGHQALRPVSMIISRRSCAKPSSSASLAETRLPKML